MTAYLVLGLLLLQAGWLLAMPPFGGMDEFDHAFRASAAGHGELFTDLGVATDGRGYLVTVNDGLAREAFAQCNSLQYTGPDNCTPVADAGDGMVVIASSAAIYQPTYYALVGWVTWFVDGDPALYAMRIVSALLCAFLFGVATWVVTGWSRSVWPTVAAAAIVTPTSAYSLVVVAPNGFEVMLGLLLWACLIGVMRTSDPARCRNLLITAVPTAMLFAWVRPFSPIWLLIILCSWLVLLGWRRIRELIKEHTAVIAGAVLLVGLAATTSVAWVLAHPSAEPPPEVLEPVSDRWSLTLRQIPLWFLQVLSAVPFRNSAAPLDVYAAGCVLFTLLLLPLVFPGSSRLRLAAALPALTTTAVAVAYTFDRLPTSGLLWQGRYMWCVALGVVVLAAVAHEDRPRRSLEVLSATVGGAALLVLHLRSLHYVIGVEKGSGHLATDPGWVSAPTPLALAIAGSGVLVWIAGAVLAAVGARTAAGSR